MGKLRGAGGFQGQSPNLGHSLGVKVLASLKFSLRIQSETQGAFSNQLSIGMPLSVEILQSVATENCSLVSGSSFHC